MVDLDEAPSFEALSYVWGGPAPPGFSNVIKIDKNV
jgi:hypothetical protein